MTNLRSSVFREDCLEACVSGYIIRKHPLNCLTSKCSEKVVNLKSRMLNAEIISTTLIDRTRRDLMKALSMHDGQIRFSEINEYACSRGKRVWSPFLNQVQCGLISSQVTG